MNARDFFLALCMLIALAAGVVFSLAWPPAVPPPVVPATAEADEFSAERARAHLRELTREPRPVGSAAHARARGYLVGVLRELGLEPELQQATGLRRTGDMLRAAAVSNIMARLPGTDSSGAVVLLSHYDSVPNAPGAADAGNGVAAILETVRALRAGPPLRNDVIVLITDAEEVGLLGAQAWVDEHPWAADTGIVLNAEGRGHAGPVMMFRTTANNGNMIRTLAQAAPWPAAESLANEIFKQMPNDTDLTVFDRAGLAGMDFANVLGLTHYHTPLDNFDNADPRTLQHHGSYQLSLARAFGNMDLSGLAAPDRSYFSLPALGVVHYPVAWALGLAGLVTLLVCVAVLVAGFRGALSAKGVGLGLLHLAVALAVLPLFAIAAWRGLAPLVSEAAWFAHGSPYESGRYLLGIGLLSAGVYAASSGWWSRRLRPADLLVAALICWALLALASAWRLPGASYLFAWPLMFAALGLFWCRDGMGRDPTGQMVVLALAALPTLLFLVPVIQGVETSLTLDMIAVPMVLLVLAMGLLSLQLDVISRGLGAGLPVLLLAGGAAVISAALLEARIDHERKKPNGMYYIADLDEQEARWYSPDPETDEWTRHFLGNAPRRAPLPAWAPAALAGPDGVVWQQQAPMLRTDGPRAELLSASPAGEGRRLRFRVTAPMGSHSTVIRFVDGAKIDGLRIDGRAAPPDVDPDSRDLQIVYFAPAARGVELEVTTEDTKPVRLYLRANVLGLPAPYDAGVPERPEYMMPGGPLGDLTRVQRTLEF